MQHKKFLLATDLDGTFLGGTDEERQKLYDWIEERRDDMVLTFVTGRDLPFIKELCTNTFVPWPDYIIGDVGTTVVERSGDDFHHVLAIEDWVSSVWQDRGDEVRSMLADEPGIRLQPTPFRYRVSYYYEPDALQDTTVRKIEQAGFDCLTSADLYLDVLPKGISKGPTLLRFVDHLSIDPAKVLAAGDTLNDFSMFETGLDGVAVGNSEKPLVAKVAPMTNVYKAKGHGAAGIQEAITALQKM